MTRMMGLVQPLASIMALAIGCGVAGFCCANFLPVVAVRAALVATGHAEGWSMGAFCAVLLVMAVARGVLHYIEQRSNHYIAFKLLAHIRDLVFSSLRRLAPAKLAGADRGALISTITSDVEPLEVFYAHTISPIVIAALMTLIMCVFLGSIHALFAIVALVAYLTVGVVVPVVTSRLSGEQGRAARDGAASLASYVLDGLRGLSQVLQFRAGERRLEELDRRSESLVGTQRALRGVASDSAASATALILCFSVAQLILAASLVGSGVIAGADALVAVVALMSSFGPVTALANLGSTLQGTLASANRVLDILDEEPVVQENVDGAKIAFTGAEADNVSFAYEDETVLDNVSLEVKPGQIVGITGRSGSGKSTLCRLLMRFWDVDSGEVRLSDTPIKEVKTASLRAAEAFVEQDTHLFHDSIRDNLLVAKPDASDEEVEAACRAASVHDFVMTLPHGYDTMVGELGDTLSGGERQRLGLARAFLHDAPFLLLDEPTSNLDSLNEAVILSSLEAQRGKRSVLLVSHRPSTMAIADKTYSMDSGRVS
ncbi:MAG: thiol reductant ABC exporter subunit CydC [Atopobiaceae bacterium]|nr:thiol reductant ABC exporter subunit CydC [Atopobiaceae bacterium]